MNFFAPCLASCLDITAHPHADIISRGGKYLRCHPCWLTAPLNIDDHARSDVEPRDYRRVPRSCGGRGGGRSTLDVRARDLKLPLPPARLLDTHTPQHLRFSLTGTTASADADCRRVSVHCLASCSCFCRMVASGRGGSEGAAVVCAETASFSCFRSLVGDMPQ